MRVECLQKSSPSDRPGSSGSCAVRRLQLGREVEDRLALRWHEVGRTQEVAARQIDGKGTAHDDHRVLALIDGVGDVRQTRRRRRRLERARAHRAGHLLVRVAERNSLADERLGGVGREQHGIGRGGGEPVAVELETADEHRERAERAGDVAPRREHRRLVLLEIAVVRER